MTTVTFFLAGPRGAQYRMVVSQLTDGESGIQYRLQRLTQSRFRGPVWNDVAVGREPTGDPHSRILAGWLTTPMPKEL